MPQADSPAHEEDGAGELFDGGQEFLDRMAIALGGKSLVPTAGEGWGPGGRGPFWRVLQQEM
jgi:hypothetical protein